MSKVIFSGWFGSQWFARGWFNGQWFVFETKQDAGGGSSTGHGHGAKKKREKKRRSFILPDDTVVEATEQEIYDLLDLYVKPEQEVKKPSKRALKKVVVLEPVVIDDKPLEKIVLPEWLYWKPVEAINPDIQRRVEEELMLLAAMPFPIEFVTRPAKPVFVLTDEELLLIAA